LGLFQSFILKQTETEEIGKDGAKKKVWVPWDAQAIQKVDDFTVRLTGQAPNLAIPEFLCSFPNLMLDPSENGVFGVGANGTGPFELTEYEAGRRAVLTARKSGYWGKGPYLDRVEVIDLGDDSAAQVAAIAAKQVDLLREGAISALPAVEKLPHVKVSKVNSAYTAVARMQPKKPFDDARVRRAMRYATDSAACLKVALRELGLPGEHFHIAPVQPAYAKIPDTGRDVAKAKALLAEAGYKDGVDIEITCKPQPDWELLAVQAMVEQWKEVGVRAKINVVPSAQYWDHFKDYPFSFTQWSHRPLATMVLELAYRTGVPWNESKWSNKEFDDLLTEAEKYLDVEKRREVMAKIEKVMFEDGPLVLPCWRAVFTFLDKKIQNFQVAPDLMYDFKEVWVEA
jgi:peptide/nickel transport system substrate-binding protein